jgi:hypothetical protein
MSTDTLAPHQQFLTPAEVALILNVSDDSVLKTFGAMEGVIDIGTPSSMHKRKKRVLRIPRKTLERFIAERQVRVRR